MSNYGIFEKLRVAMTNLFLISDAIVKKALSTFVESLAEVSKNGISN